MRAWPSATHISAFGMTELSGIASHTDPGDTEAQRAETCALITSKEKEITWTEVAQIPLCLLTPNMKNRQLIDKHFLDLAISPKIVTEASDFTAVLAQVAGGNAATIAPVSVAETFLDLKSTIQLDLTHPVMTHSVGLSVKDQSPVLPMIEALRHAVRLAL
jgi:DNA-binding transcriptional LysR family regulator